MTVREYQTKDADQVAALILGLRTVLAELKSSSQSITIEGARQELDDYTKGHYPIFVAVDSNNVVGYIVCRIDEDVVWAESLYVLPEFRRKGIGTLLYAEAERLANESGSDTVYNWVHPNNETSIQFLRKRGYTVLNLIEVRKPWAEEQLTTRIRVGENEFDY